MSLLNSFSQLNHPVGSAETPQARNDRLVAAAREFVGVTFYGTLMREVRNSAVNRETPFSPKRAEKAFTAMMDEELVKRASSSHRSDLADAIYDYLTRRPQVRIDSQMHSAAVEAGLTRTKLDLAA